MKTNSIAAVMVHVPDSKVGLEWYSRAFPEAKRVQLPEFEFECLNINGINLEVVPADEKVGSGAVGCVNSKIHLKIYWAFADHRRARAFYLQSHYSHGAKKLHESSLPFRT